LTALTGPTQAKLQTRQWQPKEESKRAWAEKTLATKNAHHRWLPVDRSSRVKLVAAHQIRHRAIYGFEFDRFELRAAWILSKHLDHHARGIRTFLGGLPTETIHCKREACWFYGSRDDCLNDCCKKWALPSAICKLSKAIGHFPFKCGNIRLVLRGAGIDFCTIRASACLSKASFARLCQSSKLVALR